ncbi:MAG: PilT/PilU family type 4a pilus ATPase [Trueperaceae bacterium]|nr:PilT/PilU family type 4a pilus ATPase [Trueperaceae bacterium]MCO5174392.1 PilT/PilU family type 4a pilus ATPase [Trueperaceae bacterium]
MHFNDLLRQVLERGASDLHLHVGLPAMARLDGKLVPITEAQLSPKVTAALVDALCNEAQRATFEAKHQVDLAYSVTGLGRFRVNLFRQRGSVSAVLRVISSDEKGLAVVNLPRETIEHFRDQEKGLVLVTGPTGSGKSTTLARIINEINATHPKMIVTVEDPIEYLHRSKRSVVVQRELGMDAPSFSEALVAAMRQDPDVILIGEIRDHATAAAAISAAQTGHLVFSTLHTQDSVRTINRMIELFPPHERDTARILFAESLVGIVSQRLLARKGGGRVAATEILKGTLRVKDLVRDPDRTPELYDVLAEARLDGMRSFDDHLAELYGEGVIDFETGHAAATSAQAFKMKATQIDVGRQVAAAV